MSKTIKTYFTGEALKLANSPFSKMRIEFIFQFSILSLLFLVISIVSLTINEFWYTLLSQCIAFVGVAAMLIALRKTKSFKVSGFIWIVTCMVSALIVAVVNGGNISIIGSLWLMFCIISVFIILGPKWGIGIFMFYLFIIVQGLLVKAGHISIYDIGIDFTNDRFLYNSPDLVGALLPTLFTGYALFTFLTAQKKTQRMLTSQMKIVKKQKQEITDSILYAKRIQSAILPPFKLIHSQLKNHFILYEPKDIIAGDFYWLEQIENKILFAVADCTGHGVPGAMVSVVCNNALNRSVREYKLTDPGQILDKTREIVMQEFEKSEEEVKDGMDIALCSLAGNKLEYAGAHNPLWIIRNGKILENKANRQPIGKLDNPLPFTTHNIDLEEGDVIYLFSDGYIDQFGGEDGKKFKPKAFRQLLLSIQNESITEQKKIIQSTFETWKGDREQIDDVCIMGVRI